MSAWNKPVNRQLALPAAAVNEIRGKKLPWLHRYWRWQPTVAAQPNGYKASAPSGQEAALWAHLAKHLRRQQSQINVGNIGKRTDPRGSAACKSCLLLRQRSAIQTRHMSKKSNPNAVSVQPAPHRPTLRPLPVDSAGQSWLVWCWPVNAPFRAGNCWARRLSGRHLA